MIKFKNKLIDWYRLNRRDLPWRKSKDPYRILVSEIMLQQTTVVTVIPYFEKFMTEFPSIEALARAPEEKILSFWSGLGYYSRARNLHHTAKAITDLGAFPKTYDELLKFKGIGAYTAAAVSSIAFDQSVAAVDGNVSRVVSRIFDIPFDIDSRVGKEKVAKQAQALIEGQPPSEHNQAMMELGATICLPTNPVCLLCPVIKQCQSHRNETIHLRPVKSKKRKQEPWLWTLLYLKKGSLIGLVKNENGTPWLKNTWTLPGYAIPWKEKSLPPYHFRHSITHHKIYVKLEKSDLKRIKAPLKLNWVRLDETHKLGVSSVVQKAIKLVPLLSMVFFLSCKSQALKPAEGLSSGEKLPANLHQLTFAGENTAFTISPDGTSMMYQSKKRADHQNSQIYILNLKSGRERRLTYNDGDDTSPSYSPTGKNVIYSSTTDELKENPLASDAPKETYPNYEIYQAQYDGSHRVRLTNSPGYDAEGVYSHDGRQILFSSRRHGVTELFIMDIWGRSQRHLFTKNADKEKAGPNRQSARYSPDGKHITWTESEKPELSQIFVSDGGGRNIKQLTTKTSNYLNPSWSADSKEIIFSSNRDDEKSLDLYEIASDGTCLKRLTNSPDRKSFALFSNDGKSLYYTSNRDGTDQIYKLDFSEVTTCLAEKP